MRRGVRTARGGFTIVELLFVILIIFLLMGLLIGGIKYVSSRARGASDLAAMKALGQSSNLFKQQFGFFPPLVRDGYDATFPPGGPLNPAKTKPLVYAVSTPAELTFLKTVPPVSAPGGWTRMARPPRPRLCACCRALTCICSATGTASWRCRAPTRNASTPGAGLSTRR